MSVDQTNVIDAIGIDNSTGDVVLTISDHLDWLQPNSGEHLLLLQEKLNSYLRFAESGELLETYPDARNRSVLISVVYKYPLNQEARSFYGHVRPIIEGAGMKFQYSSIGAAKT